MKTLINIAYELCTLKEDCSRTPLWSQLVRRKSGGDFPIGPDLFPALQQFRIPKTKFLTVKISEWLAFWHQNINME